MYRPNESVLGNNVQLQVDPSQHFEGDDTTLIILSRQITRSTRFAFHIEYSFLQASTCFHLLYFTILSLKDIQRRLKKKKTTQSQHTINAEENPKSEEQSHLRPAMCLILIHLLAVVISCTNIYIEQVSVNSYSLEILRIVFILDCCRISKNGVASSSHLLKSG